MLLVICGWEANMLFISEISPAENTLALWHYQNKNFVWASRPAWQQQHWVNQWCEFGGAIWPTSSRKCLWNLFGKYSLFSAKEMTHFTSLPEEDHLWYCLFFKAPNTKFSLLHRNKLHLKSIKIRSYLNLYTVFIVFFKSNKCSLDVHKRKTWTKSYQPQTFAQYAMLAFVLTWCWLFVS